jgi:hypothetical protein
MNASEIIKQDAERNRVDPATALTAVNDLVQSGDGILLKENDSVLLLKKLRPRVVEAHLFTVDQPMMLSKSLLGFKKKLEESDIQTVYGKADNPQIVNLMKKLGFRVEDSDLSQYNWKFET